MTKEIPISNGMISLVDDENFEEISKYEWHINYKYAQTFFYIDDKRICKKLHHLILDVPDGMEIDHIDHDGLNNQKSNLRVCTHQQNTMNKSKNKLCSSKYKGVDSLCNKWRARIMFNGKSVYLGRFKNERDAAKAYNKAAIELHGKYSNLNEI